jgi:hypothetical protein
VDEIRLAVYAAPHAVRIPGAPNGRDVGTKFVRRGHYENLALWWQEDHPRSTDYE